MGTFLRSVVLGLLVAGISSGIAQELKSPPVLETDSSPPVTGSLAATLDASIERHAAAHHLPGLMVLYSRDGEMVYQKTVGFADPETRTPLNGDSIFRLASVSKLVAAALALRMEELGLVDLNAEARALVDGLPTHHTSRLVDLLACRGGVRHYDGEVARQSPRDWESRHYATASDAARQFWLDPLAASVGEYHYSTHGYTILGAALEQAGQKPIGDLVAVLLAEPHHLPTLKVENREIVHSQRVAIYKLADAENVQSGNVPCERDDVSWKVLGGGLECSAMDLLRFGMLLGDGKIISAESLARLMERPDPGETYALGCDQELINGVKVLGKSGGQPGVSSYIWCAPDLRMVMVVLTNRKEHGNAPDLGKKLRKMLLDRIEMDGPRANSHTSSTGRRLQPGELAAAGSGVLPVLPLDLSNEELLELARQRQKLCRITWAPVRMENPAAELCRSPYPAVTTHPDPHLEWAIHVYATQSGEAPMWDPYELFPAGTVLLKEKFRVERPGRPELFTGMIKRETGYAPDGGDWEYFTLDGALTSVTARGKIESCVECHSGYRESDFVTRQYASRSHNSASRKIWDGKTWSEPDSVVRCGTSSTIYLPASLAVAMGRNLSDSAARERWYEKQKAGEFPVTETCPDDLTTLGGPLLRYERVPHKNTLGYWANVADTARWRLEIPRPGRYEASVLQGCGAESGGAEVEIVVGDQSCRFVVKDTGHFQNFVWRNVGQFEFSSAGTVELIVAPQTKPGVAVMDLRQIRLKPIIADESEKQ